jgi:NAD(P)-dependent dehydrogenase (short-subunit alcohol dehydrogenase family)
MGQFSNKTYIITGASKGLGEVVSKELFLKGASLILLGRNEENLKMVSKGFENFEIKTFDLLDKEQLDFNINDIINRYETIDGVIHVAGGGYGFREPLLEFDKFLTLLNLNLLSIVNINNIVIPKMIKANYGNIVHIGSIAAREAIASVGYNTAKAALNAYVRSIGNVFAKDGLIISGINPGGFLAPNNAMERLQKNNPEAYEEFINKRLPRKKMGEAQELLPAIKMLLSKDAGMFCGNMINADAGEGVVYS